ncbi:type I-E CRISPR-associated protein Cas6/Cse3/CasE [Goodfellowiella coeruleoviolacea]|uniref:CRISPR system Cascade subunit CasE n=1 Tax=Goodfellowiella coeruleoviolacea TaxID=334858 RepID=A0AAE3GI59_9PSEU|nr:type I-E CRISPR-associated protein Cas6/Cse3/CasE [Goodfellowiella coeruleoviolacea]MCP2166588.1 CRISPR system Cascade subunit CasE [Goodfellowiella coeruleoviolacea]
MPYLSRIRINPLRAASRTLLANPRALHAAVLNAIPDHPTAERSLWRLDADDPRRPHLLVLTQSRPDWNHLVEQAGWPDADGEHAAVADYTPLLTRLRAGHEFAFRLTANPVQNTPSPTKPTVLQKTQGVPNRARSYRIGHRTAAAQLRWFLARTLKWGFDVPETSTATAPVIEDRQQQAPHQAETIDQADQAPREVRIIARDRRSFSKGDGKPPVVLYTATFQGRLRVTDPHLLAERLLSGIGPGKAYGCGLLTLAPLAGTTAGSGGARG